MFEHFAKAQMDINELQLKRNEVYDEGIRLLSKNMIEVFEALEEQAKAIQELQRIIKEKEES